MRTHPLLVLLASLVIATTAVAGPRSASGPVAPVAANQLNAANGWVPEVQRDSCFTCHGIELIYDYWLEIEWPGGSGGDGLPCGGPGRRPCVIDPG